MSDRQLNELLDRAVQHAPPMHLDGQDLLTAGRGRVRRRRAAGAGGSLGAAAIVAAVWAGLAGGDGTLTGLPEIQPATTVFEVGEVVDATLFDSFHTIDNEQVAHSFAARLTRGVTGPLVLEVSDGGQVAERITADAPVPGLEVFTGETMTVALWREPDGVVTSVPLVGPVDPGGLTGRVGTEIGGERFGYAVWAAGVDGVRVPEEVRDVHLVGEDDVVALSGADVETAVLEVGGARAVAWSDAATGVWGYAVDGRDAVLEQLGDRPAQFSASSSLEDGIQTSVTVLPAGDLDEVTLDAPGSVRDSDYRGAMLGGRTVVLATATVGDDPAAHVVPAFRLQGGARYTLDSYADDLFTLDTPGGRPVSAQPRADGSLVLQERSGAELLVISPEDLTAAPTSWPTDLGTVVATVGWSPDARILGGARLGLVGADAEAELRWVEPTDVAQVVTPAGEVTLLSLDPPEGERVLSVGLEREDGTVERWDPPVLAAGSEWRQVDGAPVPFVDGVPLQRVDDGSREAVQHYRASEGSADGYVVLPGLSAADPANLPAVVPLLPDGDGILRASSDIVGQVGQVEVGGGPAMVLRVVGGLDADGTSSIAGVAVQSAAQGAANTWSVLGDPSSAHIVLDPGIVVSVAADQGVWLLYPTGSTDPAELQAGRIGRDVVVLDPGGAGSGATTLVAVHPEGEPTPQVSAAEGQQEPETFTFNKLGLTVNVWTLGEPAG